MMNDTNEYREKARLRKASLLVSALRSGGATVAQIDELGEDFPWDVASAVANVHPPSAATKELVRETLVFLERRDVTHPDPFEGL